MPYHVRPTRFEVSLTPLMHGANVTGPIDVVGTYESDLVDGSFNHMPLIKGSVEMNFVYDGPDHPTE